MNCLTCALFQLREPDPTPTTWNLRVESEHLLRRKLGNLNAEVSGKIAKNITSLADWKTRTHFQVHEIIGKMRALRERLSAMSFIAELVSLLHVANSVDV